MGDAGPIKVTTNRQHVLKQQLHGCRSPCKHNS